jgi:hypothetical protein
MEMSNPPAQPFVVVRSMLLGIFPAVFWVSILRGEREEKENCC